jgi:hypothetical protein
LIVRSSQGKDERGDSGRDALDISLMEGGPKRPGKPRRARVPTRVNRSGARGARLFGWEEAVGAQDEGREGFRGKREGGEMLGKPGIDHPRGGKLWRAKPRSVGS